MARLVTTPNIARKVGEIVSYQIDPTFRDAAGSKINAGDVLIRLASGYVKPAYVTGAATDCFAGVAAESANLNAGAGGGDTEVKAYVTGVFYFTKTTPAVTDILLGVCADPSDTTAGAQTVTTQAVASPVTKTARIGVCVDWTTFTGKIGVLITGYVNGVLSA